MGVVVPPHSRLRVVAGLGWLGAFLLPLVQTLGPLFVLVDLDNLQGAAGQLEKPAELGTSAGLLRVFNGSGH